LLLVAGSTLVGVVIGGPGTTRGTQPIVTYPVQLAENCRGCHGYDYDPIYFIEPGDTWAGSMMANAARDPIFWAALDVANNDEPGVGDFCLRCHAPSAWLAGRSEPPGGTTDGCGLEGEIDNPYSADFDGVTCHLCHRMMVNPAPPPGEQSFYTENAQYWIDDGNCGGQGQPCRRGPYTYSPEEQDPPHPWAYSPYHLSSDLCGTCHNVTSPLRNLRVNGVDQGIKFPIERTYKEWSQSDYAQPGPNEATCQGCHMPESGVQDAYACAFLSNDRTGNMPVHRFVGGNSWVPDVLRQEYPSMGREDQHAGARDSAIAMLQNASATVDVTVPPTGTPGSPLPVQVRVTNLTGHKLPSGYAEGRRMWIAVEARDGNGTKFWESGAYDAATGVLTHDAALKLYRADQGIWNHNGSGQCDTVDGQGAAMFHFVKNDCVALDNRIPPLGFTGGADLETRPVGYAYPETSPGSGKLVNFDMTSYSVPLPLGVVSPVTVSATLRYQIASKDYVDFLRDQAVENSFPVDCIARSAGPATESRGEILHGMWTRYGRAAPVDMASDSGAAVVAGPPTPGEASGDVIPMRVTSYDRSSGVVTISYGPACGSTDHTIYAGNLSGVPSMTFGQRVCNRGTSGTTSFAPGPGNVFWLIVGNDGASEGSYGTNKAGIERPEDTGASSCNIPQDLAERCD